MPCKIRIVFKRTVNIENFASIFSKFGLAIMPLKSPSHKVFPLHLVTTKITYNPSKIEKNGFVRVNPGLW